MRGVFVVLHDAHFVVAAVGQGVYRAEPHAHFRVEQREFHREVFAVRHHADGLSGDAAEVVSGNAETANRAGDVRLAVIEVERADIDAAARSGGIRRHDRRAGRYDGELSLIANRGDGLVATHAIGFGVGGALGNGLRCRDGQQ